MNDNSSHRAVRGALAFALTTIGAFAAMPASAAALALGAHYQESSNLTSNAPPQSTACNGLSYCYIEFAKVPAGKQLLVTRVSCQLSVSAGAATTMYLGTRLGNGNAVERFSFLIPTAMPSNQPGDNITVNDEAYQLYTQGQRPEIYLGLDSAASTVGFCSIGGELTDVVPQ